MVGLIRFSNKILMFNLTIPNLNFTILDGSMESTVAYGPAYFNAPICAILTDSNIYDALT
ncbi:hypothetical protein H5410_064214 [Solanum commersonii]|uniref:Uncharacterized protein n=1 Tax=Solanum commersonii TaxID=4109 RepID=A0A9J5W044_SOLCO|nr:hypothetical protein H5410_064214 [Solanum commersonii]